MAAAGSSVPSHTPAPPSRERAAGRRGFVALLGAIAVALVAAALLELRHVERALRSRLEREALQRGLAARVEDVRVGIWPPLRLIGLRVEKAGAWALDADTLDLTLRPWGSGLIGRTRLELGRATLSGPGGVALEAAPTRWDLAALAPGGLRAELRGPVEGLSVAWLPSEGGGHLDVRASDLSTGRHFSLRRDGVAILDAGVVAGTLRLLDGSDAKTLEVDLTGRGARVGAFLNGAPAGAAPSMGETADVSLRATGSWRPEQGTIEVPKWSATIAGAAVSGSLAVSHLGRDPRVQLAIEFRRVDLARLLRALGVETPAAAAPRPDGTCGDGDLGALSLSAEVRGRVAEPGSFTVSQELDFQPPRRALPALEALRGDFVHEVELAGGSHKSINVSPESADFIPLHEVPALFVRTLLLAEDSGFHGHQGIDLSEMPAAILNNLERDGPLRGASTITQQLVKNLFLSREKSLDRKLQELPLALLLEAALRKERILEIYLNVIEWGPGLYGLRPAARRYFDREPRELTPRQMAFLVCLIPAPVKYQRSFADGTLSPSFASLVDDLLGKLRSVDALSEWDYRAALAEDLFIPPGPARLAR